MEENNHYFSSSLFYGANQFRSGGNTCQIFLIKDPGSWKGWSLLLSAQFFWLPWSNSVLLHASCTVPLYFSQGQSMSTEESFTEKKNRPSNSTQLVADNFCRPLGKGLRQCRMISSLPLQCSLQKCSLKRHCLSSSLASNQSQCANEKWLQ